MILNGNWHDSGCIGDNDDDYYDDNAFDEIEEGVDDGSNDDGYGDYYDDVTRWNNDNNNHSNDDRVDNDSDVSICSNSNIITEIKLWGLFKRQ